MTSNNEWMKQPQAKKTNMFALHTTDSHVIYGSGGMPHHEIVVIFCENAVIVIYKHSFFRYVRTWWVPIICVESYRCLDNVPPLDFQLFNFSGHFRAAQTLVIRLHVVAYPVKNHRGLYLATVYCTNFIIFFANHPLINYFLLVSCPRCTKSWWHYWCQLCEYVLRKLLRIWLSVIAFNKINLQSITEASNLTATCNHFKLPATNIYCLQLNAVYFFAAQKHRTEWNWSEQDLTAH